MLKGNSTVFLVPPVSRLKCWDEANRIQIQNRDPDHCFGNTQADDAHAPGAWDAVRGLRRAAAAPADAAHDEWWGRFFRRGASREHGEEHCAAAAAWR